MGAEPGSEPEKPLNVIETEYDSGYVSPDDFPPDDYGGINWRKFKPLPTESPTESPTGNGRSIKSARKRD